MKIKRHIRQTNAWPWSVSGPGVEGKLFPSAGAAIAFALMRTGATGDTFYVREHGDVLYRTERRGDELARVVFPRAA